MNLIDNKISKQAILLKDTLNYIEGRQLDDEELTEVYLLYLITAIKEELKMVTEDDQYDLDVSIAIEQQLHQLLEYNPQTIFELANQLAVEDAEFISGIRPLSVSGPSDSINRVLH